MSNRDEMISARTGLQILLDVECLQRLLSEKQQQLLPLRRRLLLASIGHCSSREAIQKLWQKLNPVEQQDKDIVCKFLSCCGGEHNILLFGANWEPGVNWEHVRCQPVSWDLQLPESLVSDTQVLLSFASGPCYKEGYSLNSWPTRTRSFEVPECLRSNKEVMLAFCAKIPCAFPQASQQLRDDADLVRVALLEEDERCWNIKYVSERLRTDEDMLDYAESMGYFTPSTTSMACAWLGSLDLGGMDDEKQKGIASVILHLFSIVSSQLSNSYISKKFLTEFWSKLSVVLRDDADFMLPFVKLHGMALQGCSERLRSDPCIVGVAVSQNINAYQYAMGSVREEYERQRNGNVGFVCQELEKGLQFEHVPENLRADRDVALVAAKTAQYELGPSDFSDILKNDRKFILDVIRANHGNIQQAWNFFYRELPDHLSDDEEIAKALLKAGSQERKDIIEGRQSLLSSREVMMSAVAFPHSHFDVAANQDSRFPEDVIADCDSRLLDDGEFMLKAYQSHCHTFQYASDRLQSDPAFVRGVLDVALDGDFIMFTTDEFQNDNLDIVVEAIGRGFRDEDILFHNLSDGVWNSKEVIMACLRKGWPVLECIAANYPNHSQLSDSSDNGIMWLALKEKPADFKHVAATLREDRNFILKLVKEVDRVLQYTPSRMKYDKEILVAAMARNSATIFDCFDSFDLDKDFEFLCKFASDVRMTIATHNSFLEHRRGIVDPLNPLSMLNLDTETGISFPMMSSVESLNAALANMKKFGF